MEAGGDAERGGCKAPDQPLQSNSFGTDLALLSASPEMGVSGLGVAEDNLPRPAQTDAPWARFTRGKHLPEPP